MTADLFRSGDVGVVAGNVSEFRRMEVHLDASLQTRTRDSKFVVYAPTFYRCSLLFFVCFLFKKIVSCSNVCFF